MERRHPWPASCGVAILLAPGGTEPVEFAEPKKAVEDADVESETLLGIVDNEELEPIAARVRKDLESVAEQVAESRS